MLAPCAPEIPPFIDIDLLPVRFVVELAAAYISFAAPFAVFLLKVIKKN